MGTEIMGREEGWLGWKKSLFLCRPLLCIHDIEYMHFQRKLICDGSDV